MTHTRQHDDTEGDFGEWKEHPQRCNRIVVSESTGGAQRECGAIVRVREWESHDGAYTDYQYRCANGHSWWIDGIDS